MGSSKWADFQGVNAAYAAELYERYQRDPSTVDADTRTFFDKYPEPGTVTPPAALSAPGLNVDKIVAAVNLAESIRKFGNLAAQLDPLGSELPGDPSLIPENYDLSEGDLKLLPANIIKGPVAEGASNAWDVIQSLIRIYCSHSGYDYAHLRDPAERRWLRDATEAGWFRPPKAPVNETAVLERLTQEGTFELFLHRTFPGKTRFSIEGLGILIPVIDEIAGAADGAGASQILIGMGHRGRLNVLTHVLNKPFSEILAEFKDPVKASKFRGDLGWTGDVKYHSGACRPMSNGEEHSMVICLAPNPSHLEAVDPVVLGMARAAGTRVNQPGPAHFDPNQSLPLLIHGDASFPAQGVVAETLNLFRLPGFNTGGTIHIIANNQIGFT
ncbi:MAG: thiamine pyrophosphate-dependent enzyme, partial [Terriglobia bacterium]